MAVKRRFANAAIFILLLILALLVLAPILVVLMNSFKGQFFISDAPFKLPTLTETADGPATFVGFKNYLSGIEKAGFLSAFGYSLFITVFSVGAIILFTAMTAWYIIRSKGKFSGALYYLFVFSMIVPFQMVMFPMSKVANMLHLDNPVGIIVIYLGFGAGLSVFMFSGFVKSIPLEIEEAAMIDGCNPIQTFFLVVFPILRPTAITVAILNAMWIWNDYLLPYLVIGNKYRTIPIAVQYLQGGYGSRDMGALMAVLVLSIIPIIIFYLICQKYIIKGVVAGAVKG
ncbi:MULTISPECIES: carbohydrate ABC transporter permease [Anaerotruncus]|uniref:Carbohydrate ABC transporter permease n=2 Tax=Anaerotruncus TaxID=244127 RepID=A0A498D1A0_9FIRM|nr:MULTISPECIES: carbohydrate ABC transporter permease [Anaerotruncus]MBC3938641.1 carbohydrate ABC transporter permease [Anaerotruncus massiliensis (ex Togo et al. 2019)]RLL11615.1 carbohydrate ABC transporter permease [Anaerotruncus massiliensis (ex Liu et al. 2021)]